LDPRGRWKLAQRILEVAVAAHPSSPSACVVDRRGRLLAPGQPFMPAGIHHGETPPADLERLAARRLNRLMDYAATRFHLGPDGPTHRIASVRSALVALQARGLKRIFSVRNIWDDKTRWHGRVVAAGQDLAAAVRIARATGPR
jgi:hypothetical protein